MLTPTSGTLADYNTAILDGNPTHIKIEFPVQNVTLLDSDISSDGGVVISSIMNTDTDLTIGKAVSSELVCSFLNGSKFTGFDWTEECKVSIGVDISGTTNWVTVGYFKGQKPDRTVRTDAIQFIAYDRMQAFDVLADDFLATLTYPTTLADIYHDMCTFVGVSYVAGDEIADSLTLSFSESPFGEGLTCRGILAQIAEACGCYARINNAGVVKMTWFTDHTSDYEITADDYFGVNISESTTSVVTHIRVACTFDTNVNPILYPATNPNIVYQILDNPFLLNISSADLTTVLTAILGRFTTLGAYTPISVEAVGNWMVEDGDIISIKDENSNSYDLPVFGLSLAWNGVCGSGYECTGNTEREPLTSSAKEQYEAGGKVSNKYTIRSGVDITDEGVTISGGKFLKLISGGVLDIQATNFIISSVLKKMVTGNWTFDDNGLSWYSDPYLFTIKHNVRDSVNVLEFNFTNTNANYSNGFFLTPGGDIQPFEDNGPFGMPMLGGPLYHWSRLYCDAIYNYGNLTMGNGTNIAYAGTGGTIDMIKFRTGNSYGHGILIGGGGLVVIGAGESSDSIATGKSADDENLYLGSDENVYIMTNCQNGISSAKTFKFDSSGNIITPTTTRIGSGDVSGSGLYLGNAGNQGWVYTQDICSQSGNDKWKISQAGTGTFTELNTTGGAKLQKTTSDTPLYVQGNSNNTFIGFNRGDGTLNGYIYVTSTPNAGLYYNSAYHHFAYESQLPSVGTFTITKHSNASNAPVGRYFGKVLTVVFNGNTSTSGTGWKQIGTIASGYRPKEETYFAAMTAASALYSGRIATDGNIYIHNVPASTGVHFSVTYIIA